MKVREIEGYLIDFDKVVYIIREHSAELPRVRLYTIGGFEIQFEGDLAERVWQTFREVGARPH